jgi:hypothetical protein
MEERRWAESVAVAIVINGIEKKVEVAAAPNSFEEKIMQHVVEGEVGASLIVLLG